MASSSEEMEMGGDFSCTYTRKFINALDFSNLARCYAMEDSDDSEDVAVVPKSNATTGHAKVAATNWRGKASKSTTMDQELRRMIDSSTRTMRLPVQRYPLFGRVNTHIWSVYFCLQLFDNTKYV